MFRIDYTAIALNISKQINCTKTTAKVFLRPLITVVFTASALSCFRHQHTIALLLGFWRRLKHQDHKNCHTMRIEMSRGGNKPQSSLMKETRPLLKTTSSLVSEGSMGSTAVSTTPTTATVDWIRNAWIIQILVGVAVIGLAIWQNSDERWVLLVVHQRKPEVMKKFGADVFHLSFFLIFFFLSPSASTFQSKWKQRKKY